jgi:hypothetical protein
MPSAIHSGWRLRIQITFFKEDRMKIELDGTLVRMTPENDSEKKELNHLWRILIDCVNKTRKLVPVGEYIPHIKEVAVFNIED